MNSPTMKGWCPLLRTVDVSSWGLTLENVGRSFSINSLFECQWGGVVGGRGGGGMGGGGGRGVRSNPDSR